MKTGRLVATVLLLVMGAAPAAAHVRVEVKAVPCASPEAIAARVEALLAQVDFPTGTAEVTVEAARPGILLVRLKAGTEQFDRPIVLDIPADCSALADTVAAVVRGCLRPSWEQVAEQMAGNPSGASPLALEAAHPPPQDEGAPAAPASDREAVLLSGVVLRPAPPPPPRWRAWLSAGALAPAGTARERPVVLAGVEYDLSPRWGLALLGSRDGEERQDLARAATLSAVSWQVDLLGRFSLALSSATRLDALAGPSLQVLAVRSRVLRSSRAAHPMHSAASAVLRLHQGLGRNLAATVGLGASCRLRDDRFYVVNLPGDLTLSRLRLWAAVGLALALD